MGFAAVGAAEVLTVHPDHEVALHLLADAAHLIDPVGTDAGWSNPGWRWPEDRLRYANAVLCETLLAAGDLLGEPRWVARGLDMLEWLLGIETGGDHLSVTPAQGWSLGEPRPGFDQQPIEVAALADASARAHGLTGDRRWAEATLQCAAWFEGSNDAGIAMIDPVSGGGHDGLEADGRNENQGAESTLAMLSTSSTPAGSASAVTRWAPPPPNAMSREPDLVRRSSMLLLPDACRVIVRPFLPGHELPSQGISRADAVVERLVAMPESDVEKTLAATLATFSDRHVDLRASFREHYQLVAHRIPASSAISSARADLIGAYLTHEYSIEAAALFNPSIAAHPDQSGLAPGELRFVMTARAVGEGHVSSLEFRTGTLAANDVVRLDEARTMLTTGRMTQTSMSTQFLRDALDEDGDAVTAQSVLGRLPEQFSPQEARGRARVDRARQPTGCGNDGLLERIRRMAASSYELTFPSASDLSARVIFPTTAAESHGIEDARLVRFVDQDGSIRYYATYTAFDGSNIAPHLLSTEDFETFSMRPQVGPAAKNKGMALFPRHIGGRFWSLSRWDRESIQCGSRDALRWETQSGAAPEPALGDHPGRRMLVPARDSPGVARHHPRGRADAHVCTRRRAPGPRGPEHRPGRPDRAAHDPGPRRARGLRAQRSLLVRRADPRRDLVLPYGCSDSSIRFAFIDLPGLLARLCDSGANAPTPRPDDRSGGSALIPSTHAPVVAAQTIGVP